jgi:hypothetical protein
MTWEKVLSHEIHIDHTIPITSFDLEDPEQQLIAFNYKNTTPMWAKDNLSKGSKLNWKKDNKEQNSPISA